MATKTFTNTQLATHWTKAAKATPQGTRRDVVLGIMADMEQQDTPENYRKVYNNVTQRVKQLAEGSPAIVFPALAEGKKGARRSGAEIAALQAILSGDAVDTPAGDKPADEEAPASEDATAPAEGTEQPAF